MLHGWLTGSKVTEGIADFRLNTQGTLLASAARTGGAASPTQTNYNAKGVLIFLDVTAASGTGGLRLHIRGLNPVNNKVSWLNAVPTSIIAVGQYCYEYYPGVSGAGGDVVQRTNGSLPRTWAVEIEHMDGSSYTYSVGYANIL